MYYLLIDVESHDYVRGADLSVLRMVEFGYRLLDENYTTVDSGEFLIQPRGYKITRAGTDFHGITHAMALQDGVPIEKCLDTIAKLLEREQLCLVAHNVDFDRQIVSKELRLAGRSTESWLALPTFCTVLEGASHTKIPNPRFGGYKYPTLEQLYRHFIPSANVNGPIHRVRGGLDMLSECFRHMKAI